MLIYLLKGEIEFFKWLLDNGADVNKKIYRKIAYKEFKFLSPLAIAMTEGNVEIALLLRLRGGEVDGVDSFGVLLNDKDAYQVLRAGCLESNSHYKQILAIGLEGIKKVFVCGSHLESILCSLHLFKRLLSPYLEYNSIAGTKLATQLVEALAFLIEALPILMNNVSLHLSEETRFIKEVKIKEALYKKISNQCSDVLNKEWRTVVSPAKDQEFKEACHTLKEQIETLPVNPMDTTTEKNVGKETSISWSKELYDSTVRHNIFLGKIIPDLAKEIDGLIEEAKRNNLPEVAEWFIKNKDALSINGTGYLKNKRYYEPMVAAAMCDQRDVIKFLCDLYYDINVRDNHKNTVLGLYVSRGQIESVKWLLEEGADVNHESACEFRNSILMPPLLIAMVRRDIDMTLLLRSKDGQVDCVSWPLDIYNDQDVRLMLIAGCLESQCYYRDILDIGGAQAIKKILIFGSHIERILCGLHFFKQLLSPYLDYDSIADTELATKLIKALAFLIEELPLPMNNLFLHLSEETFVTKLETKEVLYKRISNQCFDVLNKEWPTIVTAAKDQEFKEACHTLKEQMTALLVNEVSNITGETLDQAAEGLSDLAIS